MSEKTIVPGTGCYGHTHYDGCGCTSTRLCCGCTPAVWQVAPHDPPVQTVSEARVALKDYISRCERLQRIVPPALQEPTQ